MYPLISFTGLWTTAVVAAALAISVPILQRALCLFINTDSGVCTLENKPRSLAVTT